MQKDFNPTKKDLLLIDELILNIKSNKSTLVGRKMSLENSLTQLREKRKELPYKGKEFMRVDTTMENIKNHLHGIELKIKGCNEELQYKNKLRLEVEFHIKHNKSIESREDMDKVMNKLTSLKTKYSDFSKDRTRVASLRVMACEFLGEIENILKTI